MTQYPEVQRKAQLELDTVIGQDRLPEFSDLESLPYIRAMVKELLRWHIVAPIALPHRIVADDEYNGYLLPGDAIVLVNIWYVASSSRQIIEITSLTGESREILRCTQTQRASYQNAFWILTGNLTSKGEIRVISYSGSVAGWSLSFLPRTYNPTRFCRICPGRHFVEASLAIMIASVLTAFNIYAPSNNRGAVSGVEHEATADAVVS